MREAFSVEHAMKGSDEDGLIGVEPLRGAADEVRVAEEPGDDLDLLGAGPPGGEPVVPGPSTRVVQGALGEEGRHSTLSFQDNV